MWQHHTNFISKILPAFGTEGKPVQTGWSSDRGYLDFLSGPHSVFSLLFACQRQGSSPGFSLWRSVVSPIMVIWRKSVPHSLVYLNTWFLILGWVLESLGSGALLTEACHWGVSTEKIHLCFPSKTDMRPLSFQVLPSLMDCLFGTGVSNNSFFIICLSHTILSEQPKVTHMLSIQIFHKYSFIERPA